MILDHAPLRVIHDQQDWEELRAEIRAILYSMDFSDDIYFDIANTYNLPIHLTYLIIDAIRSGRELELNDLSSITYYSICRDILTPYKNKNYIFYKFFNITYPYLKNTDERLEWFLKYDNGLTLSQKVSLLEEETSFNTMGVGRTRFEQALFRINLEATKEEIERRRLGEYDGIWAAAVASFIKKERGDLTAAELLLTGDRLAEDSRISIKIKILSYLISRMGKIEVYFLANQVTKFHDRVSRTSSLLRAFSKAFDVDRKMIERLVSMHSMVDVAKLVEENKILEQFEKIIPFRKFKPMLAAKWERQYNFPMAVEAKYDGVRLLVHKLGPKVACFSRRRKNYMYKFPQIAALNTLIPAYSVILDGEITAQRWTPSGIKYLNVYELNEAIRHEDQSYQLIYVIFDVLFLNGMELINYPFKQRRKIRHELVEAMKKLGQPQGLIYREIENYDVYNKEQLIHAYNQFVQAGFEGAIVKFPDRVYELGKRTDHWLKLKPKETMDVTITGVIPLQDPKGLRVWGIRYAVLKEDEFVNLGMIRGLDTLAGIRLAEMIVNRGLIDPQGDLVNLTEDIESRGRFTQAKESMGFEIEPDIVITIDSLGMVRKGDKIKLRNARFLHIREDKEVSDISTYYDLYHTYMTDIE